MKTKETEQLDPDLTAAPKNLSFFQGEALSFLQCFQRNERTLMVFGGKRWQEKCDEIFWELLKENK